jgi:hypothetical protein
MLGQLQKNIEPLLRRKLFVKIPIGSIGFSKTLEFLDRLLHAGEIPSLAAKQKETLPARRASLRAVGSAPEARPEAKYAPWFADGFPSPLPKTRAERLGAWIWGLNGAETN